MAKYENIQEKARKEIKEIIGSKKLTYELIKQLKYIPSIIKETMRMFPSACNLPPKQTTKDVIINGYSIPKGTNIWIAVYGIHHSSKIYENPEEFKPERWLDESKEKKIPINAWLPFGSGPRQCLGNTFTLTEQCVFFTELLMNFKISLVNHKNENIEFIQDANKFILNGPKKIPIHFKKI